jgi:hypothetical protein
VEVEGAGGGSAEHEEDEEEAAAVGGELGWRRSEDEKEQAAEAGRERSGRGRVLGFLYAILYQVGAI